MGKKLGRLLIRFALIWLVAKICLLFFPLPFNSANWKSSPPSALFSTRRRMVDDLLDSKKLIGLSSPSLIDLLGPADSVSDISVPGPTDPQLGLVRGKDCFYKLVSNWPFNMYYGHLHVLMNEHSKVYNAYKFTEAD